MHSYRPSTLFIYLFAVAFKDVCSHRVASVLHQIFLTIKILLVVVNSFA